MIYVLAVIGGMATAMAVYFRSMAWRAESEVFDRTLERDEALGRLECARRSLQPLQWAYDFNQGYLDLPHADAAASARMRHYLAALYSDLQDALGLDDVQMAEVRDRMRMTDPPRRLPKYPQIPPYLATPEDAVQRGVGPATVETAREMAEDWRSKAERLQEEARDARQEAATEATLDQAAAEVAGTAAAVNAEVANFERCNTRFTCADGAGCIGHCGNDVGTKPPWTLESVQDGAGPWAVVLDWENEDRVQRTRSIVIPGSHALALAQKRGETLADGWSPELRLALPWRDLDVRPQVGAVVTILGPYDDETKNEAWMVTEIMDGHLALVPFEPGAMRLLAEVLGPMATGLEKAVAAGHPSVALVPDSGTPGRSVLVCDDGHRFEVDISADDETAASIGERGIECPTCGAALRLGTS